MGYNRRQKSMKTPYQQPVMEITEVNTPACLLAGSESGEGGSSGVSARRISYTPVTSSVWK